MNLGFWKNSVPKTCILCRKMMFLLHMRGCNTGGQQASKSGSSYRTTYLLQNCIPAVWHAWSQLALQRKGTLSCLVQWVLDRCANTFKLTMKCSLCWRTLSWLPMTVAHALGLGEQQRTMFSFTPLASSAFWCTAICQMIEFWAWYLWLSDQQAERTIAWWKSWKFWKALWLHTWKPFGCFKAFWLLQSVLAAGKPFGCMESLLAASKPFWLLQSPLAAWKLFGCMVSTCCQLHKMFSKNISEFKKICMIST